MDEQRIFVGRQVELNRFREILEDPRGQTIVVVGQAGMGKTWLIDRMVELATQHPSLKCGWVRYEVTPTDSPDSTMAVMMDNAFEAAQTSEGSFDMTDRRRAQWMALLRTMVPKGREVAELLGSLRRDPQKHTREQFLERLRLISKRVGPEGRALFVVDPEKYICRDCADSWRLVTRELPEKVKFLFAQRPEDELVSSNSFMALENVVRLPTKPLGVLAAEEVDDLVRLRAHDVGQPALTLHDAVNRYHGHPYAIQAALEIVKKTKRIEDLPQDPTNEGIAATQWQQICRTAEAIRLFEAYAILEVAVPLNAVQGVSSLDTPTMKRLLSDSYLRGLLQEEGQGKRIYHAILADHVRDQIDHTQQRTLHRRAACMYRRSLEQAREKQKAPDPLAATRLPEHSLNAEGPSAFVDAFVHECTVPLVTLGLLDTAISLSLRSLVLVAKGTQREADILGNLGVIYRGRDNLDEAEKMLRFALNFNETHRRLEGVAVQCGNLGVIHQIRGELDEAERMHRKAVEIYEKLGRPEEAALQYANLAAIWGDRGDIEQAEKLFNMAIKLDEKLGRLEDMARDCGNLGLIYQTRGELDDAERMHKKALEINERLGQLQAVAWDCGNLGEVNRIRGDLNEAERMHRKALAIEQRLNHLEGIADSCCNLGLIYEERGNLDNAEKMLRRAIELHETLGRLGGVAHDYGVLGLVYQARGDFDEAEKMHRKALEIDEKLERLADMADDCGNLGLVYQTRGDLDKAETMLRKALAIDERLGRPEGIAIQHGNLGLIYEKRGDFALAREHWEKALALFQRIGARDRMRTTQAMIDGLPKGTQ